MSKAILSGKVFLVVTGASQGIGRQIAVTFGKRLGAESKILLLARNEKGLKETAEAIGNVEVECVGIDLGKASMEQLRGVLKSALKNQSPNEFEEAVIVHNAGSVGNVSISAVEMTDKSEWQDYYSLNVFSPALLNSAFVEIFGNAADTRETVINISSLCGLQPFKSLGFYCSGKAARDMYFKVFAIENPQVNVLNYAPGPVKTEMFLGIRENVKDSETKSTFDGITPLTTEQTIDRLVHVLSERKYKSGDHVDYFDEL